MLNVRGQVYVTNLKEVSPKMVIGDVYCHEKLGENDYSTTFVNAKFVGESVLYLVTQGIKNKDKVFIDSAILRDNKYTNKEGKEISQLQLTVFKLSSLDNNKNSQSTKNRFER